MNFPGLCDYPCFACQQTQVEDTKSLPLCTLFSKLESWKLWLQISQIHALKHYLTSWDSLVSKNQTFRRDLTLFDCNFMPWGMERKLGLYKKFWRKGRELGGSVSDGFEEKTIVKKMSRAQTYSCLLLFLLSRTQILLI